MLRKIGLALLPLCTLGFGAAAQAQTPQVYAYLSSPNAQYYPGASIVPGATSETFTSPNLTAGQNHTGTYSSAIGAYSGTFATVADDQYGNGTGNYFSIGAQSSTTTPVTLTFSTAVTYFGLSYCAGDNLNGFTFYDASGNNLGRYSTATLLNALKGSTVTAIDGTVYNSSQYMGKPNGGGPGAANTGTNTQQPYSFVNFFASQGTTIKSIVFDNSSSASSGFESDNHTISTDSGIRPPTTGSFVYIGSSAAPDAGSLALCLTGLPLAAVARRRKVAGQRNTPQA